MPLNIKASEVLKEREALKLEVTVTNLRNKTPAQAADYIETNVTDLASAKRILKILTRICLYQLKQSKALKPPSSITLRGYCNLSNIHHIARAPLTNL